MASYPINSSNIKIFDIEQDPDMQDIQAYMGFLTGGRTVIKLDLSNKFINAFDFNLQANEKRYFSGA